MLKSRVDLIFQFSWGCGRNRHREYTSCNTLSEINVKASKREDVGIFMGFDNVPTTCDFSL